MSNESKTPDLVGLTQRLIDAANARDIDAAMNLLPPTSSGRDSY